MTRNGFRSLAVQPRSRKARLGMVLGGLCVIAASVLVRYYWGTSSARAQVAQAPARPASPAQQAAVPNNAPAPQAEAPPSSATAGKKPIPDIVAMVNNQPITRDELAAECRVHYGKEVLEALVNKYLILQECRRRGVAVSRNEVDEEIEQMAKSFNLPVEQWLKLLKQERAIKPDQYANDIIWPTLALRKLAGDRLTVTQDELATAFEAEYGPSINARMIVCSSMEKAQKVQAMAAANPADFGNLAKTYSDDSASASMKGLVQPIRKHSANREIEQAAFAMSDGEVSKVLHANAQYVIVKREKLNEARPVRLEQVASRLEKIIRDRKMRSVASEVFKDLQEHAVVKNVLNDPVLSRQMTPGVVAIINDAQISIRQLDDECLERHGQDVLDGAINRKLVEQACRRKNVTVTPKEIDEEIARAAAIMVRALPDGSPDVKAWLDMVTKRQGVSIDVYKRDVVWPSVALRKLTGGNVAINEDDLRKGFEANYGPRVRCRAIVMNNQRRAQQVWEMARKDLTADNFSELATKYSIEGGSRALGGEVPPIRRFGGQPLLEEEAFSLKQGEISGVIQLEDKFVILYCEGHTKPVEVEFAKVRELIYEDIHEKKLRLAMGDMFEQIQDTATIDNFLNGTSRSPAKTVQREAGGAVPAAYQTPMPK